MLEGKKNRKLIRNGLKSISSTVLKNGKDLVLFRRSRSPCDFRQTISFAWYFISDIIHTKNYSALVFDYMFGHTVSDFYCLSEEK